MPCNFTVYGQRGIDQNTIEQMNSACSIPVAVAGSLQADAHLGYGLPIGGVLALDNAVCPYAVGVDIACRMKVSIFDIPALDLDMERRFLSEILEDQTHFGVGVSNPDMPDHPVLHEDWGFCDPIKDNFEKAKVQLGTSGSGNHFVEWCTTSDGRIALMSHSGSRGPGAAVCNYYSKLAKKFRPTYGEMAWLDMDSELGQEYWAAMQLMGRFAAANHDCIHRTIANAIGRYPIEVIENHHNFAWKETHKGREVIVHRKGATPAGLGVMGVIPGSMGTPAYIVEGKGHPDSLCSSSHGAGRLMSRKAAKKMFDYDHEIEQLDARGITVLSAGADEVCGCYKDIETVMEAQQDLVKVIKRLFPKIVKMAPYKKKHWTDWRNHATETNRHTGP